MQSHETAVVPATPIRKLLCRLPSLRRKRPCRRMTSSRPESVTETDVHTASPAWAWGEFSPTRKRPLSNGNPSAHMSASATSFDHHAIRCSNAPTQPRRAQIAIQQYDEEHDAIVISTLPCYPFCCHQDLLAMSRPRLLQTAYLFNSCLPFSSRFTDLEVSSDGHIRRRIEELVGIVPCRTEDIMHPGENEIKAISDSLEQCELEATITSPSSPLGMYPCHRNGVYTPRRSLDVVVEEDESDFSSYRTVKRRKMEGRNHRSWDEL